MCTILTNCQDVRYNYSPIVKSVEREPSVDTEGLFGFNKRLMARLLNMTRHFRFSRLIHIITVVFVFSYIAFDVLDLDLSDFPLKQASQQHTVVIAETPKAAEVENVLNLDSFRIPSFWLQPSLSKESVRLQQKQFIQPVRSRDSLIHLHRLHLPQSADASSSPAA
jgi:hypothetical protein